MAQRNLGFGVMTGARYLCFVFFVCFCFVLFCVETALFCCIPLFSNYSFSLDFILLLFLFFYWARFITIMTLSTRCKMLWGSTVSYFEKILDKPKDVILANENILSTGKKYGAKAPISNGT
ncbi:hypothetical protein TcG_07313 [Trypanosoma cruzi]|nr:hypothetical protein TcG_07313 [Trypanosoma cruzi]